MRIYIFISNPKKIRAQVSFPPARRFRKIFKQLIAAFQEITHFHGVEPSEVETCKDVLDDDAPLSIKIAGGSIVIHTVKKSPNNPQQAAASECPVPVKY
jgi:hypothetical protein